MEFKRTYGTHSDEELARTFGLSVHQIGRLAREFALGRDKRFTRAREGSGSVRMPRWRKQEVEFLRREYASRPNLELARRLGRSVKSLTSKAHRLGLKKSSERIRRMGQENVDRRYHPPVTLFPEPRR